MAYFIIGLVVLIVLVTMASRRKATTLKLKFDPKPLLEAHVSFYQELDAAGRAQFLQRILQFLQQVKITGVGEAVPSDLDRVYVAASAIIPIHHFKDWKYNNLNEVLLYSDIFNHDYSTDAQERNIAGMVGSGAMNRMMILSLNALRAGFEHNGRRNTGIHEFVHLLDKADGSTDGVPEYMLPSDMLTPWMQYMHREMNQIRHEYSDIDSYAGTNEAEFFAVVSEYFFQKPHLLEDHHPQLYSMLARIYNPRP